MPKLTKKRIFEILDLAESGDSISRVWDIFIISLICLNVGAVILETVQSIHAQMVGFFRWFEVISVAVFTVEYVLRLWSVTAEDNYKRPFIGRLKYAFSFLSLVDLFAILPFYLPFLIPIDLRMLRALRLLRIFRILKVGRYSKSIASLGYVLKEKKEELAITAFVVGLLLIVASSLMFYVENPSQPEVFSSIPASMWWGVATLTTVGYGDVYPVTTLGKILGACIAILGVGLFALPAGILAGGFAEALDKKEKEEKTTCPECGHRF